MKTPNNFEKSGFMVPKLSENKPVIGDVVQEARELFYSSLNPQMNAMKLRATGVELASAPAFMVRDVRCNLVHEEFSNMYADPAHATNEIHLPTSPSWLSNFAIIANLIIKFNNPDWKQYTDVPRLTYNTGILEHKLLGLSLWYLSYADLEHEAALFEELRVDFNRFGIAADDPEFRGAVRGMSPATWARAKEWLKERTSQLETEYGALAGIFKPFVDAYVFNHRSYQLTGAYVDIDRHQRRPVYSYPGMSNCVVRNVLQPALYVDGVTPNPRVGQEVHNIAYNGLFTMENLFDWLMADLTDFRMVLDILQRKGSLDWLVDKVDPVALGTNMFKGIRPLERNRTEPVYYEYSRRIIVTDAGGANPLNGGCLQNALSHKWCGVTKPTWYASVHFLHTVRLDLLAECIFEDYLMDPVNGIDPLDGGSRNWYYGFLGLNDLHAARHCNVFTLTYKQTDAAHGSVLPLVRWAAVGELDLIWPYVFCLIRQYGIPPAVPVNDPSLVTLYNILVAGIDGLELMHADFGQETMFSYEIQDSFDFPWMRADVPAMMFWNTNGVNGHLNYIEHFCRGTLGSFAGNVYPRNYMVTGGGARQLSKGQKRENRPNAATMTTMGNVVAEDTVGAKDVKGKRNTTEDYHARDGNKDTDAVTKDSAWIPDDKWAKMSPAEKKTAKAKKD